MTHHQLTAALLHFLDKFPEVPHLQSELPAILDAHPERLGGAIAELEEKGSVVRCLFQQRGKAPDYQVRISALGRTVAPNGKLYLVFRPPVRSPLIAAEIPKAAPVVKPAPAPKKAKPKPAPKPARVVIRPALPEASDLVDDWFAQRTKLTATQLHHVRYHRGE